MDFGSYLKRRPIEKRKRSIVKTLCYRLFMLLITISVAWLITGSTTEAMSIGIITNFSKTLTYYSYERVWNRITWGHQSMEAV